MKDTTPHQSYPHHPGTPDADVAPDRLAGRRAYRAGFAAEAPLFGVDRVAWFLGWYDEALAGLFGRQAPTGRDLWAARCKVLDRRPRAKVAA